MQGVKLAENIQALLLEDLWKYVFKGKEKEQGKENC